MLVKSLQNCGTPERNPPMTNTIPDADALIAKLRTMRDTAIATFGEPSDGYYYGVELAIKVIQDNAQPQAQGDAHRARVAQGLCSPKNPCNSCIALMPIPKPQGDCRAELEKAAWKASRGEGI